jgi:hypothetical protein
MIRPLFLLFTFSLNCFGQGDSELMAEMRKNNYQIDWKYNAGEYLIFDCDRNHYACVNDEGNNNCLEERKFAIETKEIKYPCAPLKKFSDKKTCVKKNYQIVDLNAIRAFCYPK